MSMARPTRLSPQGASAYGFIQRMQIVQEAIPLVKKQTGDTLLGMVGAP